MEHGAILARDSGWSLAKVIGFLAHTGRHALGKSEAAVNAQREDLNRAIAIHRVVVENERRLAAARKELRSPGRPPGWRSATAAVARATKARAPARSPATPAAAKP